MKPSKKSERGADARGGEPAAEMERREKEIEEWGDGKVQRARLNKERQLLDPESAPKR
jgi:hypothetical protein